MVINDATRLLPVVSLSADASSGVPMEFERLVEAEHTRLYGALCLITRNRAEAEDIAQEAFLRVWERWERVSRMEGPSGYLYRIAMNLFRKKTRRAALAFRRSVGLSGRDEISRIDEEDVVVRALAKLTPRQRASVVLVDLLDFTSAEAAELMSIKAPTVRVLASQGRAALRRNAGEWNE